MIYNRLACIHPDLTQPKMVALGREVVKKLTGVRKFLKGIRRYQRDKQKSLSQKTTKSLNYENDVKVLMFS